MSEIPLPTLKRLPLYYTIFFEALEAGKTYISSYDIAETLGIDKTQVRKDIALTGYIGKPKVGYEIKGFMEHLDRFLGLREEKRAIVIGAGNLGGAIIRYPGLAKYGFALVGVFDADSLKIGRRVGEHTVRSVDGLDDFIRVERVQLAILSVPGEAAQGVSDRIVSAGIQGIWNFTPVQLKVPAHVAVWNQNLTASFLTLSMLMRKEPVSVPYTNDDAKQALYLCMGSACHQQGSYHVLATLKELIGYYNLGDKVELKGAFCLGHCAQGITMKYRDQIFTGISRENITERFLGEIFPLIK